MLTHTCAEVQNAVVLIVDRQDDVRHRVRDLIVCGQVQWSHAHRPDHVLDFRVVSDDAEVLDVVGTSCRKVLADALAEKKRFNQFRLGCALE